MHDGSHLFGVSGIAAKIKTGFWESMGRQDRYARGLHVATALLANGGQIGWRTFLHHIPVVERFAFWNLEEWSADPDVRVDRERFLRQIREFAGPRLRTLLPYSERRLLNRFLSRVESFLNVPNPYCRPSRARLELTDDCNLRCRKCPPSVWQWKRHYAGQWILDRARSLYPWIEFLDLSSFGESFLSPLFGEMMKTLPSHLHTYLGTNGILLNEELTRLLVEYPPSEIHVSIDSADRATYQEIRGIDAFEKVLRNCRRISEEKTRNGAVLPKLYLNITLEARNLDQVVPSIELASNLSFQGVVANHLTVWSKKERARSIYWHREETCDHLDEGDRAARRVGVEFHHFRKPLPDEEGTESSQRHCSDPWQSIHLRASGHIATCCLEAEEYEAPESVSWEEVWDGPDYRDFRQRVNLPGNQAPPICQVCFLCKHIPPGDRRFHLLDDAFLAHTKDGVRHFWLSPDRLPRNVYASGKRTDPGS